MAHIVTKLSEHKWKSKCKPTRDEGINKGSLKIHMYCTYPKTCTHQDISGCRCAVHRVRFRWVVQSTGNTVLLCCRKICASLLKQL